MSEALQQQDWNAVGDDEFRRAASEFFAAHVPTHLRHLSRRPRWAARVASNVSSSRSIPKPRMCSSPSWSGIPRASALISTPVTSSIGAGIARPMSAQELCEVVRIAYDPPAALIIDQAHAAGSPVSLTWGEVGPSATQAAWATDVPEEALRCALGGTWRGTLVASIAASAAYASLMVTSFRGFYQFGVMGATGAIFCWLATYSVLPAMLTLLDRRVSAAGKQRAHAPLEFGFLAKFLRRHAAVVSLSFAALGVLSVVGMGHFLKDPFEYDFRKLNAKLATTEEAQQFNRNLDRMFGRWPSPTILLADSVDEVEPMRKAIRRQDAAVPGD